MPPGLFGHVGCDFFLQTLSKAVVEEEELTMRKQAAKQDINTTAFQQDLEEKCC